MIEKIQKLESEINEKLKSNNVVVRILGNEDKNKGSIIILKDKKINRCFEIEIMSCSQINIIENSKKIETGLFYVRYYFNDYIFIIFMILLCIIMRI